MPTIGHPIASAMARAVARPTRIPVKPPGPHDTAMVFKERGGMPVAFASRAIIGASAVAWPCEVAMISCAGGAALTWIATEQAEPEVSIASKGRAVDVEAGLIGWVACDKCTLPLRVGLLGMPAFKAVCSLRMPA